MTIWLEWVPKGLDLDKHALGAQGLTIGSCSMLTWEHVEKISEISTMWIARYELSNSQKSFSSLQKIV